MQKLHLVGFTTDREGLILSTRRGARSGSYVVALDEALEAAIEDLRASKEHATDGEDRVRRPRAESSLSVKEIQARLRHGRSITEVAKAAGVDEEWVERFAPPVLAERAQVVARVRAIPLHRPRLGVSRFPIGDAVRHHLADRGVALTADEFADAWTAHQVSESRWAVRFTYRYRGKSRTLQYDLDESTGDVSVLDRTSAQMGYVAPGEAPSANRPRSEGPEPRPKVQRAVAHTGYRAGAPDHPPRSRSAREREKASAAMRKAAVQRAAVAERAAARKAKEREQQLVKEAKEAERERARQAREDAHERARQAREQRAAAAATKAAATKAAAARAAKAKKKAAATKAAATKAAATNVAKANMAKANVAKANVAKANMAKAVTEKVPEERALTAKVSKPKTATTKAAEVTATKATGAAPERAAATSRGLSVPGSLPVRTTRPEAAGPLSAPRPAPSVGAPAPPRTGERPVAPGRPAAGPAAPPTRSPAVGRTPRFAAPTLANEQARLPQFRTGLVEQAADAPQRGTPTAPSSSNGTAAAPGRPRRTRPLRAD